MTTPGPSTATTNKAQAGISAIPVMTSHELLGQQGALQIDHQGAIYTLRSTSKGGLILTK